MRLTDFFYFLRQIFFPNWKPREEGEAVQEYCDDEPNRFTLCLEWMTKKLRSRESVGTAVSLFIHALLLLLLSWWMLPVVKEWGGISLTSSPNTKEALKDVQEAAKGEDDAPIVKMPEESNAAPEERKEEIAQIEPDEPMTVESETDAAQTVADASTTSAESGTPEKKSGDFVSGGGYEGRTPEGRGRALGNGDSSARGEDAVEKGLIWIMAHQMKDGGWSFDFDRSCKQCSKGGAHGSRLAATALALLPFLGAGYNHDVGPYQRQIDNGLNYLIQSAARGQRGIDFMHGGDKGMYAHGIAAMTLCEAHAMSRRKRIELQQAAQESLRFIEEAQDSRGGGWRYKPNEHPGDFSVTTWQIMALKSGRLGGLQVSQPVLYNAVLFLDTVADKGGREYKYVPTDGRQGSGPDSSVTCSASGLLLRMYLGWEPGEKPLDEGIDRIAQYSPIRIREIETEGRPGQKKPTKKQETVCNLYYAYYSTLALHHYGGSNWHRWNSEIREFLIQTQSNRGHEAGSWYFPDPHYCDKGGRLLNTALAILVLETPYRIMPLFRKSGR